MLSLQPGTNKNNHGLRTHLKIVLAIQALSEIIGGRPHPRRRQVSWNRRHLILIAFANREIVDKIIDPRIDALEDLRSQQQQENCSEMCKRIMRQKNVYRVFLRIRIPN